MSDIQYCMCGCGEIVTAGKSWKRGHNSRKIIGLPNSPVLHKSAIPKIYNNNIMKSSFSSENWIKGWTTKSDDIWDVSVLYPMRQSAAINAAITTISDNMSRLNLHFFDENGVQLTRNQPVVQLFSNLTQSTDNAKRMTTNRFLNLSASYLSYYGEVFYITIPSQGQLLESSGWNIPSAILMPSPKQMSAVVIPGTDELIGWEWQSGNKRLHFTTKEVIQIKYWNPYNAHKGLSKIDTLRLEIDNDFLSTGYSKAFFMNGASPSTVFTVSEDDYSSDEQREEFLKDWNQLHRGVDNAHKAAVLHAGMGVEKTGLTQEEMSFIETRKFDQKRIFMVFKTPPPIVGDYDEATYSNIDNARKIFWDNIKTITSLFEDTINNYMLSDWAPGVICKFDFSDVTAYKKDDKALMEIITGYAKSGIPVNPLIEAYGLNIDPIEGGDIGWHDANRVPLDIKYIVPEISEVPVVPEKVNRIDNMEKALTEEGTFIELKKIEYNTKQLMIQKSITANNRLQQQVYERQYKKSLDSYFIGQRKKVLKVIDNSNLTKAMSADHLSMISDVGKLFDTEDFRLRDRMEPLYRDTVATTGSMALINLGSTDPYVIDNNIINQRLNLITSVNRTIEKSLRLNIIKGIEKGESIQSLKERVVGFYDKVLKPPAVGKQAWATRIARTESSAIMSNASLNVYTEKGDILKGIRWITASDSDVRDEHIKNQKKGTIAAGSTFPNGEKYPGQNSINCRCTIIPIV